jgi:rhodanese-related sulfurtransferase
MLLGLTAIGGAVVAVSLLLFLRMKRLRDQREIEQHSITVDDLHSLLNSHQGTLLFDVRQPLDLLANPEIIPGSQRLTPADVLKKPSLIPREKDVIVYCTCPGEKTSRAILHRALGLHINRIRFLMGGLAAWKAKGYPVEPYREVFSLDTPGLVRPSG